MQAFRVGLSEVWLQSVCVMNITSAVTVEHTTVSVSYTHLDVYKRQGINYFINSKKREAVIYLDGCATPIQPAGP